jgi:hypothetical protein
MYLAFTASSGFPVESILKLWSRGETWTHDNHHWMRAYRVYVNDQSNIGTLISKLRRDCNVEHVSVKTTTEKWRVTCEGTLLADNFDSLAAADQFHDEWMDKTFGTKVNPSYPGVHFESYVP